MTEEIIKVGDYVTYRGCFGMNAPMGARVTRLEVTDHPRGKYGKAVESVTFSLVRENRVVFSLDNCTWCYSEQIDLPIVI